jgi:hypothetical protein
MHGEYKVKSNVYFVTPTYVSAVKLPSSGSTSKNHKYLWHPDTHTFGIIMKVHMPLTILKLIDAYSHKNKR